MAITTRKVRNPKVNGVYQVSDVDLRINSRFSNKHTVIVTSINKKNKTCRVKTVTSLEDKKDGRYVFRNSQLENVKNGSVLVIPKTQFKTKKLSGINHNGITVGLDKLYYKEPGDNTRFPKRYHNLIHKK